LIETDCPFLPPQSHRGKRNEPAYLPMTLAALARIRGESPEIMAQQTTENALRLFTRIY
jgi:TatD DNase family protein